jgi:hypothetical protein
MQLVPFASFVVFVSVCLSVSSIRVASITVHQANVNRITVADVMPFVRAAKMHNAMKEKFAAMKGNAERRSIRKGNTLRSTRTATNQRTTMSMESSHRHRL